jgi:FMN phosphatase YigB (HAD superfamily)
MRFRAAIFDIYDTLLERGPAPIDAEPRWQELWRKVLGGSAPVSLEQFANACEESVRSEHAIARALGVAHPEVFWPDILAKVRPELAALAKETREEFTVQHAQLLHTARLMPGASDVLKMLRRNQILLGLASNAQPYTKWELEQELAQVGLNPRMFHPELCLFSFELGFSKPDPHFFRLLRTRLHLMGVEPVETLFVGNRLDNDLAPARAQGWQTWQFSKDAPVGEPQQGPWPRFELWLAT